MSKMSDMTEYHASAYRLPSGFEHCSKLKPVAEAATALDRVKAVVDVLYSPGGCPWDGKQTNKSLLKESARGNLRIRRRGGDSRP